jgi:hypothetical protein
MASSSSQTTPMHGAISLLNTSRHDAVGDLLHAPVMGMTLHGGVGEQRRPKIRVGAAVNVSDVHVCAAVLLASGLDALI